jgi:orotidine-5'-phosphate decarboxylase
VEPFLRDPEKGVFVLAVTSNPGARDFQYLNVGAGRLYERVIRKVRSWNTGGNCGLVVGATRPAELRRIRGLVPDMPILIPGIGAQGGDLSGAVRYGCTKGGLLAVINAGRSILYASSGEDFAEAARRAAAHLRDEINRYRAAKA